MNLIKTIFLFYVCFLPLVVIAQTKAETLATIDYMRNDKQFNDALVLTERMLEKAPDDLDLLILRAFLTDEKGDRVGLIVSCFNCAMLIPIMIPLSRLSPTLICTVADWTLRQPTTCDVLVLPTTVRTLSAP